MIYLAGEFRMFLVEQGIGRFPRMVGDQPTIYVDPIKGAPWGGDFEEDSVEYSETTITLVTAGGLQMPPEWLGVNDTSFVDITIRAASSKVANETSRAIVAATNERKGYEVGSLHVERSGIFRSPSAVPVDPDSYAGHIWTMSVGFVVMSFRYKEGA